MRHNRDEQSSGMGSLLRAEIIRNGAVIGVTTYAVVSQPVRVVKKPKLPIVAGVIANNENGKIAVIELTKESKKGRYSA